MTKHYHHTYTCLCGEPWFDRSHTLTYTGPGNEWSGRWLHSPGPGHRLTRSR